MSAIKNREIIYQGHSYEVFWATLYAEHICTNFPHAQHQIRFGEISDLLQRTLLVNQIRRGTQTNYFVFLGIHSEAVYETYLTLQKGTLSRPGRAIVHTSYRSNKAEYVKAVTNFLEGKS